MSEEQTAADRRVEPYDFRVSVTPGGVHDMVVRAYGHLNQQTLAVLECVLDRPRPLSCRNVFLDLQHVRIDSDAIAGLIDLGARFENREGSLTVVGAAIRFGGNDTDFALTS